jgi:hypothetical protein
LVHDRVRYRNMHDDEAGAIDLLLTHPVSADGKIADWWKQRENLALVSLRNGQVDTAYRLASQHGFPAATTEPYMGAEWLSGWIALRFKNDPQTASRHFKRMYDVAVFCCLPRPGCVLAGARCSGARRRRQSQGLVSGRRQKRNVLLWASGRC